MALNDYLIEALVEQAKSPIPQAESSGLGSMAMAGLLGQGGKRLPSQRRAGVKGKLSKVLGNVRGSDVEVLYGSDVPGHAGHLHFAAQKGIVPLGKKLQKLGFDVGEHPAFGGVAPVHTSGSHHYNKDALDINYRGGGRWGDEAQALGWLERKLTKRFGGQAYYG